MKQIVDKLNKIAKKIDENVDIPNTDLITDSLDAITTALGGTPNDSNLIVDKLEDIAGVAHGGGGGSDLFETVELTITLAGGASYDLIAPAFYTEEEENFIISIDENLEDAENVFNIIIPTNGSAYIKIIPSAGANVFIDSGDITQAGANSYTITGNAEVTVVGK